MSLLTFSVTVTRERLNQLHAERSRVGLHRLSDEVLVQTVFRQGLIFELADLEKLPDAKGR